MIDIFNEDVYLNKKVVEDNNLDYIKNLGEIKQHNKNYINKKLLENKNYFDNIFINMDKNIILDEEQRMAILKDEDYNLIIAGAGSGKTTTMMAKIKYLIDIKEIHEEEILAISFAKKNTEELKEKLLKYFNIDINVTTFHKLGLDIILKNSNEKYEIIEDSKKQDFFMNYLKEEIYKNEFELNNVLNFLTLYLGESDDIKKFKTHKEYCLYQKNQLFNTVKGDIEGYNNNTIKTRKNKEKTIIGEKVRSKEEVEIANFLYLNGIDYEYEKRYPCFLPKNKIYCPDFTITQGENIIYLEHFGINENGTSELYNKKGLDKYKEEIKQKIELHRINNTKLFYTFSKFNDEKSILEHLEEILIKNNFILKRRDPITIFNKLFDSKENEYFVKFVSLVQNFISNMKLNNYNKNDIDYLINNVEDRRTKLFLKCIKPIYFKYNAYLDNHNMIDFDDMIIKSIKIINKKNIDFKYKYIIVDEYQDISLERFELIKTLAHKCDAKITAVGDDWQAIFSFAGSNVDLFTYFKEKLGYRSLTKIVNTYRNSQELIDVASEFVEKDEKNIKKHLHSNKHLEKPICVLKYEDGVGKTTEKKAISIVKAIGDILSIKMDAKIMLLGRYNNDMKELCKTDHFYEYKGNIICNDYKNADIVFYTVHRSKGMEADYVIIINAINSTFGFPSKIKDDDLFKFFKYTKENFEYAEERRLFYVALTRTKNKVYIITSDKRPSQFLSELKENHNVEFCNDIEFDDSDNYVCPKCGGYLKYVYYNDMGQYVYRCCTDKEICGFMTMELLYKYPIKKCPDCDGYLLLKQVYDDNKKFIGCTNYKYDGTGCNYKEIK